MNGRDATDATGGRMANEDELPTGDGMVVAMSLAQGFTYVATGLWPLAHMRSFEAVTGPKRDGWLVKTVGLLVTAIGATWLAGARDRGSHRTTRVLGATSAAALAAIDIYYAGQRRIRYVYLADAVLELAFVGGWLASMDARDRAAIAAGALAMRTSLGR
jgi:hypothetical protein